ncbi:MAG: tRNA 2-thiouridine(34) synthase MnmA [Prevotellaceae bacterium]|jgi:tRNA-specific 2-thiouridylase|nr:tRNA 2-thiouridine(34) synthase MnmA [Prevotellaceae bacterium]
MMKIAVGLSGGVDSAVAAYLLKRSGHDIIGMFMQNWHNTEGTLHGNCSWEDDLDIAKMVARKLDIPFEYIDLSEEYSRRVVDYMFAEYERGRTPNPDILCNREIKFDVFIREANRLGADRIATGHYCRIASFESISGKTFRLIAGADPNKDQSYFLCQLSQEQLSKAVFPVGHLLKPDVRRIAAEQNLPNADRKDSQGICFVGKVDLPVFLQQKLAVRKGDTVEIMPGFYEKCRENIPADDYAELSKPFKYSPNDGKKIGTHDGAHFFTTGQRRGISIGGHAEPLFVVGTDIETNTLYVGEGRDHPGLFRRALFISRGEIHWIRNDLALSEGETLVCDVRIRYRQPLQKATLAMQPEGLYIIFDKPQRSITPGQFAAWYFEDELMGSGVINA